MPIYYDNMAQIETFDDTTVPLWTSPIVPENGVIDLELRVTAQDELAVPVQFKTWLMEMTAARNTGMTLSLSASAIAIRNTALAAGWTIPLVDNGDGTFTIGAKGGAATTIMWGIWGNVLTMDYLTFHPA